MGLIPRTGLLLQLLVRASCWRPALTVALSLALAALGVWYTLQALSFKTSSRDLLPPTAPYVTRYAEYLNEFGELADIVVVIEGGSFEAARAYAARLVQELKASSVKFRHVAYRVDPKRFLGRQLLYLSTAELRSIRDKILDHQDFLERFAADPGLAQLLEGVNAEIGSAFVSNLLDLGLTDGAGLNTRFLGALLDQVDARLGRPTPYRSPWGELFKIEGDRAADAGYFLSEDKTLLFVLVEPPEGDAGSFVGDQAAIEAIREVVARLRPAFPAVQVGVTGAPALSNDEMTRAFKDSEVATVLAFGLTLLVMMLAFRRVAKPVLMVIVLGVTLAWSMGIVTLTVGHLTIFSVMFISIVVGIGIDYGIYFLFRYEEEILLGRGLREALEHTAARSGPGTVAGALTAGGTFFVLVLTDFRGIQELGFIAGISILLAWLGMLTCFPALLLLADRRRAGRLQASRSVVHAHEWTRVPAIEWLSRHPVTVLSAAAVVTALALWALPSAEFDYNLLNLQAKGTESVVWEKRILAATGRSGFNGLASAESLEELRAKQDRFERLPSVSEVDSVLHLIPADQEEKIGIIKSFASVVAPVRIARRSPVDLDRLRRALADLGRRFDLAAAESGERLPEEIERLREKIGALLGRIQAADREMIEATLGHLQAQLYRDFVSKFHGLQRNLYPVPIRPEDLPEELRRKFVGASSRFLIQIHPKVNIWERSGAEQFVQDLRSVDPEVTGPPVISYEAIRLMERAYLQGTAYAFVLVGGLTFVMIRRLRETMLAVLPLVLGLLWTIGLMHLFDLKFTLANIFGLPLIIGSSAEFGLNVVMRYLEREPADPLVARSTVMAVALNGLTTMVGFGSLLVASHQGIFGLGLLLTVGAACGMAASLLVVPVLLGMIRPRAVEPATAAPGSRPSAA